MSESFLRIIVSNQRRDDTPGGKLKPVKRLFFSRPILLALLGSFLFLLAPVIRDGLFSGLLILEVVQPLQERIFSRLTSEPLVERVTYIGQHRLIEADLYAPRGQGKHGGVILVHGVNEVGKADPRMVWFARLLSRAGFVVLVPDFLGLKSMKLRTSDIGEMVDSFLYLSSLRDRIRPEQVGLVGFSYGAGPTLLAAADPRIREKVQFVVSFGGYYDLVNVIRFITTGFYEYRGDRSYMKPSDYDRWIFFRYNLDLLSDPRDKAILAEIAEARVEAVETSRLVASLTPEGMAVYNLMVNRDPDRVETLISRLPLAFRQQVEQLSPARSVQQLQAYVFIVHGEPDPYIPHTESLRLADALKGSGKYHLGILKTLHHVRPALPRANLGNILKVYLPEAAKLYLLTYDLLSRRR